jgi:hypothetical protein
VRKAKKLVLICRTSQNEAVKISVGVDQSVEGSLVLSFWNGRLVEVDVGVEKPRPFGEVRLPNGCDACLHGGLHCACVCGDADVEQGQVVGLSQGRRRLA